MKHPIGGQHFALIILVLAMLIWASSLVALKYAFQTYDPMLVIWGRMLFGSVVFLPLLPAFCRLDFQRRDLKYLLVMAACEPCLYFIFEAKALALTTASQAGMVTAIFPLLVALLAGLLLGERISRRTQLGFVLAMAGVMQLSLAAPSSTYAPAPLLGNFYEFLAMLCAAGYTVCLKHLTRSLPPLFLTAFQAFVGALFFALPVWWNHTSLPPFHGPSLLAIAYLGVVVTVGAYGCYNFALSRMPASTAAGYVNLIPVFSVLLGMLLLGERLNGMQWLACGLVFGGIYLSGWGHVQPEPE